MADQDTVASASGRTAARPRTWAARFDQLTENPWIRRSLKVWALLLGISVAVREFPGLLKNYGTLGNWLAEGLFRLFVFSGAFSCFWVGSLFLLGILGILFTVVRTLLYSTLLVVTFGRIRFVKIPLPEWLKSGAESAFFSAYFVCCTLFAFVAAWRARTSTWAGSLAGYGIPILLILFWVSLRGSFPTIGTWLELVSDRWKQLTETVRGAHPFDQLTFTLLPPAALFSAFLLACAVFGPLYVSDWLNFLLGGSAALSFIVIFHRGIARPLSARFTLPEKDKKGWGLGALFVLAGAAVVWILVGNSEISPVPAEARMLLWLSLYSDRPLSPKEWSMLPSETESSLDGVPRWKGWPFYSLSNRPTPEILDMLNLGDLRTRTERRGIPATDSEKPFDWITVEFNRSSIISLYSANMRFHLRPRALACLAKSAPFSGTVFWRAPEDVCNARRACNLDGADALLSSPVVQQALESEKAKPVAVLGEAQLVAFRRSGIGIFADVDRLARTTGRVLLVQGGTRFVMTIVGKKGTIPGAPE